MISAASVPVVATQLNWAPTCEIDHIVNYRFAPILGMFKVSPTKFVWSRSSIRCQETRCPGLCCPSQPLSSPTSPWQCQLCQAQLSSQQVFQTEILFFGILYCFFIDHLVCTICFVHQVEALMENIEDDMEGLVTSRDPALLEEMIHRQAEKNLFSACLVAPL